MKKILIVLSIMASGCASLEPVAFSHPRGDQAQYEADGDQCEHEAMKHAQVADPRYNWLYGQYDLYKRRRNLILQCMEAKGYIKDAEIITLRQRDHRGTD